MLIDIEFRFDICINACRYFEARWWLEVLVEYLRRVDTESPKRCTDTYGSLRCTPGALGERERAREVSQKVLLERKRERCPKRCFRREKNRGVPKGAFRRRETRSLTD